MWYNDFMTKKCTTCREEKPTGEFYKRTASPDGLEYKCKSCTSIYYSKYRTGADKKDRKRDNYLARTYGLTAQQYDELLARQNYACALCRKEHTEFSRKLAVDHDHNCCPGGKSCGRCVRGLLCPACNTFLGKIEAGSVTLIQIEEYRSQFAR